MSERSAPVAAGIKQKGEAKTARVFARYPIAVVAGERLPKPPWIRVRAPSSPRFYEIKKILREHKLHTVCEEASCPNIGECFGKGTATFMIMGDICTRRCPFCDVAHGRPLALDPDEPLNLARTIAALGLSYVVVTSVDRDDLRDGGAGHFRDCIRKVREISPRTSIEVLVPDFRGRLERALDVLAEAPPDVMNHNLETVPRLYRQARPGSDYAHSLELLAQFKRRFPDVPTKSGLMVGLGERDDEILAVMRDMRAHAIDMLTLGQYLQPTAGHLPVARYVHPDTFAMFEREAYALGFRHAAVGALVRSSYHADRQAHDAMAASGLPT
jgi:lipoic acid synthetase